MKQHLALTFHNTLQLWSLGFVKHLTCHHYAILKLKGKCQLSICLGKLSIGKIVGKMPIIHLCGKAFNWQNFRENANYPFVWKKFQLEKL
jgi:hypothetical protein